MWQQGRVVDKGRNNGNSPEAAAPANRVALLLAGGDGNRLRDLTREIAGTPIPKQYCRLLNGASLLEAAISRVRLLFPMQRIHVIINENHIDLAKDQVRALPASNIFGAAAEPGHGARIGLCAVDPGARIRRRHGGRISHGPLRR